MALYLLETDTVICESLRTTGDYAPDEKALLSPQSQWRYGFRCWC